MQEIILKARYFEIGLSKSLKIGIFLSSFEPSPFQQTKLENITQKHTEAYVVGYSIEEHHKSPTKRVFWKNYFAKSRNPKRFTQRCL